MTEIITAIDISKSLLDTNANVNEFIDFIINILTIYSFIIVYRMLKKVDILEKSNKKIMQSIFLDKVKIILRKKKITNQEFNDLCEDYQICRLLGCNGLVEQGYEEIKSLYFKESKIE